MLNHEANTIPIIGITMGDYNGIGPEVLIKALVNIQRTIDAVFVIIGSSFVINSVNNAVNQPVSLMPINTILEINTEYNIFVLDIFADSEININYGSVSEEAGFAAAKCLQTGVELALNNSIQALITAPICKQALAEAGYKYPGQTEMLAELTNTKFFAMILITKNFRIGLVTTHCAISEVANKINREVVFEKIKIIDKSLRNDFCIKKPRIAVTSLNPHGGEEGLFGNEEQKHILPAILEAKQYGIEVSGPFPADTLFAKVESFKYDAYIAMYHDQGLIPLKMKAFGKGVNFTAGLPIIRTSPDHGTAFDIAGKWVADESSMIEAIKSGYNLAKKRAIS